MYACMSASVFAWLWVSPRLFSPNNLVHVFWCVNVVGCTCMCFLVYARAFVSLVVLFTPDQTWVVGFRRRTWVCLCVHVFVGSTGDAHGRATMALWLRTAVNRDVSTGPLARPFTRSLALLTFFVLVSLARSAALIHSLACSVPHSFPS